MIQFPCLCGHDFDLPDSMAAESFQCPKCFRLVSVPTLDDLAVLNPDGTYNFDPVPADMQRRGSTHAPPPDSAMPVRLGGKEIGLEEFEALPPIAPRYDPETGELIREIGVSAVVMSAEERFRPLPQPSMKSKMLVIERPAPDAWLKVFSKMIEGHNLVVLLAMFLIHLALVGIYALTMQGLALFYFAPVIMFLIILSQYAATVEETGPEQKDELPRPMRDFDMATDIWLPMVQTAAAMLISFAPAAIWHSNLEDGVVRGSGTYCLIVLGFCLFPALLLTASVDGGFKNFRPHCVCRIMVSAGWEYGRAVAAMTLGTALICDSMWGMAAALETGLAMHSESVRPAEWYYVGGWISLLFLPFGLYLTYYACWLIGLIWRGHHDQFGWVARFEPEPSDESPETSHAGKRQRHKGHGSNPAWSIESGHAYRSGTNQSDGR